MFVDIPRGTKAELVEVFPRDGLQALSPGEYQRLTTHDKIDLCRGLAACGIREIEASNFAHPTRLPQMADAEEVIGELSRSSATVFRALVPNVRGLDRAIASGCQKACVFIVCSETYQEKNVGMDIERNVIEIEMMKDVADDAGLEVSVGIGTAFVCPYEGRVAESRVHQLIERFYGMGFREIGLADTAGLASPGHVFDFCKQVVRESPDVEFGLHLHDRHGLGLTNVVAGLEAGIRRFETSLLGIGAGIAMLTDERSMGNVATEHVVYLLDALEVETGIDRCGLVRLAKKTADHLGIREEGFMLTDEAALEATGRSGG